MRNSPDPGTAVDDFRFNLAVFGLLSLLVGLAYGNSLQNGFVFDDEIIVVKNAQEKRFDDLPALLKSDYWIGGRAFDEDAPVHTGLYRPLVMLSYALQYRLQGLDGLGYHLANILLHLLVTWLLYLVGRRLRLTAEAALVAAALFAVHPIHTEAVTGVVGRAELLMAASVLAGLWWAARDQLWPSLTAFGVGLLSKEQAVVLPILVFLFDWSRGRFVEGGLGGEANRGGGRGWLIRYGSYACVLALYAAIRAAALNRLAPSKPPFVDNPLAYLDWYPRLLTVAKVAGKYLWLCLWPSALSADYSYNAIPAAESFLEPAVWGGLLGWAGLLGIAAWSALRGERAACFCIAMTVMSFLPASNLFLSIGTIMGERLFYLPSSGLCLLAGLAWGRLSHGASHGARMGRFTVLGKVPAWCLVLVGVLAVTMIVRTAYRNRDWTSTAEVVRKALEVVPGSAKMHLMAGDEALRRNDWEQALEGYATGLGLYPAYTLTSPELNAKLGTVFLKLGREDEALMVLERAKALTAKYPPAEYNLGLAYVKKGRYEEAEQAFRHVLQAKPDFAEGYSSLSHALAKQRKYLEALAMAEAALQRRAGLLEAHYNRARALEGLERWKEAVSEYERVLALDPTQAGVQKKLERLRGRLPAKQESHFPSASSGSVSHEEAGPERNGY